MHQILITGGAGKLGSALLKVIENAICGTRENFDFTNATVMNRFLDAHKAINIIIHCGALVSPPKVNEKVDEAIRTNIIGTANIVKICSKLKIKLIYFSTNYVYPGTAGNYRESDPLLPINNYAWSKLGGESAVHLYKNSLILRVCMTEKPFIHKNAFLDFKTNFIFQEEIAKILFKVLPFKGIINLGGKAQSVYNFAKDFNKNVNPISRSSVKSLRPYPDISMNISKLKKSLKKN
jgi:dTDP-4-dehydrorhamnose reductase